MGNFYSGSLGSMLEIDDEDLGRLIAKDRLSDTIFAVTGAGKFSFTIPYDDAPIGYNSYYLLNENFQILRLARVLLVKTEQ